MDARQRADVIRRAGGRYPRPRWDEPRGLRRLAVTALVGVAVGFLACASAHELAWWSAARAARLAQVAPEEWRQAMVACGTELVIEHASWPAEHRPGNWRPGR